MEKFILHTRFEPTGDQPQAIEKLVDGLRKSYRFQTLLGVTGSGKTFTMANIIAEVNRPTLIIAPNKVLAAQLYNEFKQLFPENAVEYFVSYYDYYQPEAYVPEKDLYIEKDSSINEQIDRMRHSATRALIERKDVIIVATVSCIYGIGSREYYERMILILTKGEFTPRDQLLRRLAELQYERKDIDFHRGTFRVRGDIIDIFPPYSEDIAIRVGMFGNQVENIYEFDPLTGHKTRDMERAAIYPATHWITPEELLSMAIKDIKDELQERLQFFRSRGKLVEAERLEKRTMYDIELLETVGYCPGIENYSRHLSRRKQSEPPTTIIDFFPKDFLIFIDESHLTIPQLHGMFEGDRSRKLKLVEYGFRLPSALDNRPLIFDEFEAKINQVIFVSATPGPYELKVSSQVVEQIIRPTGLIDPEIEVRPAKHQVDELVTEIKKRVEKRERILVTTLTQRMAEELSAYLRDMNIKATYLHAQIGTLERVKIIREFRKGIYDVIVGINLLREGLDLPEVSLVAILDADREGFLRGETALIQTFGRAARNAHGKVILFADRITTAMERAIKETTRRREIQQRYNMEHGIIPRTIVKPLKDAFEELGTAAYDYVEIDGEMEKKVAVAEEKTEFLSSEEIEKTIEDLKAKMREHAEKWEFEKAAEVRDRIKELQKLLVEFAELT